MRGREHFEVFKAPRKAFHDLVKKFLPHPSPFPFHMVPLVYGPYGRQVSLNMNQDSIINMKNNTKIVIQYWHWKHSVSVHKMFRFLGRKDVGINWIIGPIESFYRTPLGTFKERHKIWHVTQLKWIFRKKFAKRDGHIMDKENENLPNLGRGFSPSRNSEPRCRMSSCLSHSFISLSSFITMLNVSSFR